MAIIGAFSWSEPERIAHLADRVEQLITLVEGYEERQRETDHLARKALALAEEGREEDKPQERPDRTLAELCEKREVKGAKNIEMLVAMVAMGLMAREGL